MVETALNGEGTGKGDLCWRWLYFRPLGCWEEAENMDHGHEKAGETSKLVLGDAGLPPGSATGEVDGCLAYS